MLAASRRHVVTVPKPVARLTGARPEQPDVAQTLKAARRLIKIENYAAARKSIELPLEDPRDEARRLRVVAESWAREGRSAEAAECLRKAYAIRPTSYKVVEDYLSQLSSLGNFRTAIVVYEKLSKRDRRKWEIAWEMHRLYERLGWTGHADRIRRDAHVLGNRIERLAVWTRRVIRPLLVNSEHRQLEEVRSESANLASFDGINYQSLEQRYKTHAQVDRALLATYRIQAILSMLFSALRVIYLLTVGTALVLYLMFVPDAETLVVRLAIGLPSAGLTYIAGQAIWDAARTYAGAAVATGAFILMCLVVGVALRQIFAGEFVKLVGQSLLGGAAIVAVSVVGGILTAAFEGYVRRRVNRRNARGLTMGHLADLIVEISDPGSRDYRAYLCWKLESAAKLLDRDVPKQVLSFDTRTATWIENRCAGAAEGLRHIKMLVLSPAGGSWEHLARLLRQQLAALATENWRNLFYRKPPAKRAKSKKETLRSVARLAVVALLPAVSLYAVGPWLDFGGDALKWARIVAFGWAVLSVLFALDPSLREKVETAGSIVSAARGSGDKSRPDGERASG